MYGNYVRTEDADTNTASVSINLEQLAELSRKYKVEEDKSIVNKAFKPVRWNTGTKVRPEQPVRFRAVKKITERYHTNMKELDQDLNNSFIEDPNNKIMETPQRKRDSGSFTETAVGVNRGTYQIKNDNRSSNFDDSLIRAFQPFNLNSSEHTGATMTPGHSRSKSSSPCRDRRSADSGSFTADTGLNQEFYREPSKPEIRHGLTSALKSLGEMPRIGAGLTSRDQLMKPVRFNFNKENVPISAAKDKQSIKKRLKALSGQENEPTQTASSKTVRPLVFDTKLQATAGSHSSLRTQASSRLASAPSLVSTERLSDRQSEQRSDQHQEYPHRSELRSEGSHRSEFRSESAYRSEQRTEPDSSARNKSHAHTHHSFIQDVLSSSALSDRSHSSSSQIADRSHHLRGHSGDRSHMSSVGHADSSHYQSRRHQDGASGQTGSSIHSSSNNQTGVADRSKFEAQRYRPVEQNTTDGAMYRSNAHQRLEQPQQVLQTPMVRKPSQADARTPMYVDIRTPRTWERSSEVPSSARSISMPNRDKERTMPPPSMSISRAPETILSINNRRYKILKLLGKGGSSRVYEALDEEKNTVVAIKRVDLSSADEAQASGYLNEINLLKKLREEDRIVRLHDFEQDEAQDILYVVMEKGDTDLASLLKDYANHKEITAAMIKHYWTEMLHAVSVIHKRGIIHSDLKPANFLLVAGRLKLIDFGIASAVQSEKTSVMKDTQMGTFNFMSPEAIQDLSGPQYDGSGNQKPIIKISFKSDVWSLGCILYNLTYGKMPFGDIKIPLMKLQAILNPQHKISFPSDNVDPLLRDVIKSCLTRDVKSRPSIEELLNHSYVTGIETKKETAEVANAARMMADLENNLAGVLSPSTFEKTRKAIQSLRGKD